MIYNYFLFYYTHWSSWYNIHAMLCQSGQSDVILVFISKMPIKFKCI